MAERRVSGKVPVPGLDQFLSEYPGMSIAPVRRNETVLKGTFDFSAQIKDKLPIQDSFQLQIVVSVLFPRVIPEVVEVGKRIPRNGNYHINSDDDTLCLGSPLRLRHNLASNPTLLGFANKCLLPYLYNISYRLKYGSFPFGELAHGVNGVLEDYMQLLGLENQDQVKQALSLLGMRKRVANKKSCPCGCKKRLGSCRLHYKINALRNIATRGWFRAHAQNPGRVV